MLTVAEADVLAAKEGKSRDQLLIYDAAQLAEDIDAIAGQH